MQIQMPIETSINYEPEPKSEYNTEINNNSRNYDAILEYLSNKEAFDTTVNNKDTSKITINNKIPTNSVIKIIKRSYSTVSSYSSFIKTSYCSNELTPEEAAELNDY